MLTRKEKAIVRKAASIAASAEASSSHSYTCNALRLAGATSALTERYAALYGDRYINNVHHISQSQFEYLFRSLGEPAPGIDALGRTDLNHRQEDLREMRVLMLLFFAEAG